MSKNWVSDSPYLHTFDGLEKVYAQIEERPLEILMNKTGYNKTKTLKHLLPDGKKLVQMDFERGSGFDETVHSRSGISL
mgnify:FL=1